MENEKSSRGNKLIKVYLPPNRAKIVTQYNLEGKKINVFKSTKEAERRTSVPSSSISAVANGKLKTTGGFIWKYGNNSSKISITKHHASTYEKIRKISKPVIKYSLEGKQIAEYPSIAEASRREGISVSRISSVINGSSLSAKGYSWKLKLRHV